MSVLIASNEFVRNRSAWSRNLLNVNHILRLFKNDLTPDAATLYSAFVESTFPGYSFRDLDDDFELPVKILDGHYQIQSSILTWTPSASSSELAYGYYVSVGSEWELAIRFDSPIDIISGSPFSVRVTLSDISLAIL